MAVTHNRMLRHTLTLCDIIPSTVEETLFWGLTSFFLIMFHKIITYCWDQNYSGSGKMFSGINFGKITDFIAGQALSGINYHFQLFSGSALLADKLLKSV